MEESVRKMCVIRSLKGSLKYANIFLGFIVAIIGICVGLTYIGDNFPFTAYNTFILYITLIDICVLCIMAFFNKCIGFEDTDYKFEYLFSVLIGCMFIFFGFVIYDAGYKVYYDYPPIIFETVVAMLILAVGVPFAIMYSECFRK